MISNFKQYILNAFMSKSFQTFLFSIQNEIAFLTLNSPPTHTMTPVFFDELWELTHNYMPKESFKGLIISSSGRHFSVGADVQSLLNLIKSEKEALIPQQMYRNSESLRMILKLNKPVVAILKGICYGSAMELALCADYRIGTKQTLLSLPETSFGLMPGLGGGFLCASKLGFAEAAEAIFMCNTYHAEEALNLKLLNEIAIKDDLFIRAQEFIKLCRA